MVEFEESIRARILAEPIGSQPSRFTFPVSAPVVNGVRPDGEEKQLKARILATEPITNGRKWDWAAKFEPVAGPSSSSSSPPAVSASTDGFNWAAAGIKLPVAKEGEWKCSTCMVKNDAGKTKCAACETDKPGSSASTPAASGGFNWAAAGMDVPQKVQGEWACEVCMVKNAQNKVKCAACETEKPDGTSLAASSSAAPVPASAGFNWAAAGLKQPQSKPGEWACSVCMVKNPAEKSKCLSCETDRA